MTRQQMNEELRERLWLIATREWDYHPSAANSLISTVQRLWSLLFISRANFENDLLLSCEFLARRADRFDQIERIETLLHEIGDLRLADRELPEWEPDDSHGT